MSLSSGLIAAVALTYMAIMFAIAFYGDRYSASLRPTMRAWVYSLSLAVYCTSWTFFGAVGQAAEQLWSFLPIYLGPIVLGQAVKKGQVLAVIASQQISDQRSELNAAQRDRKSVV